MRATRVRLACDPSVHLLVDGVRIGAASTDDTGWTFHLPAGASTLRLVSRVSRPDDIGHTSDTRLLGICVYAIEATSRTATITLHANSPTLCNGFFAAEDGGGGALRWTDGNAELPPLLLADDNDVVLRIAGYRLPKYFTRNPVQHVFPSDAFENLGADCTFALVQRHFGSPASLSLLRWVRTDLDRLIDGLTRRFDGVGDPKRTELTVVGDDDFRLNTPYFRQHTFIPTTSEGIDRMRILQTGCATLRLLRRKLLHDIAQAKRIFVFTSDSADFGPTAMRRLHAAITVIGPASTLCVRRVPAAEATTGVTPLGDGLYAACVADAVDAEVPFEAWRAICNRTIAFDRHWRRERAR